MAQGSNIVSVEDYKEIIYGLSNEWIQMTLSEHEGHICFLNIQYNCHVFTRESEITHWV